MSTSYTVKAPLHENRAMATTTNNDATLLLRLPSELKAELARAAAIHGQKLNSEVIERLNKSCHAPAMLYSASPRKSADVLANDNGPAVVMSDADRAMLDVFRKLPPEKQLALLSLFR